jgi:hypothetical protein
MADRSLLPGAGEVDAARTRRLQILNDYLPELFIRTRRTPRLRFLSVTGRATIWPAGHKPINSWLAVERDMG